NQRTKNPTNQRTNELRTENPEPPNPELRTRLSARYNLTMPRSWLPLAFASLCVCVSIHAQSGPNDARAREIYKELVEINTTDTPAGNVTRAAEAVAARLRAAGFPETDIHVLGPDPRKHNVV